MQTGMVLAKTGHCHFGNSSKDSGFHGLLSPTHLAAFANKGLAQRRPSNAPEGVR